jgi:hypothetical protein
VCLKHTAKAILHSANALPSVTPGKERSANCTSAKASLPSTFCRALGKDFAECHLALGKKKSPSRRQVTVTDLSPSAHGGTRQRRFICRVSGGLALGKEPSSGPLCQYLCRVSWQWHSAKNPPVGPFASTFAECLGNGTRQRHLCRFPGFLLCRVPFSALGKDVFTGSQVSFFAKCHGQHSAKMALPVPRFPSLPSARVIALGKATLCRVLHSAK